MNKLLASVVASGTIGVAGLGLLMGFEGNVNRTYLDPAGIPTICTGHTGPDVRPGMTKSDDECAVILARDILSHRAALAPCVNTSLTHNEYDAVLDLAFNVGTDKVCKSTLLRKLNAGDRTGASNEFLRWNKAVVKGRLVPLRGLTRRREAERVLFLTPDNPYARPPSTEVYRALQGPQPIGAMY